MAKKTIARFSQSRDTWRRYVSDSPTLASFTSLLKAVDQGDIAALCELQEEMEAKSPHLQGVATTRRGALTALAWAIDPQEKLSDDPEARRIAEEIEAALRAVRFSYVDESLPPGDFSDALAFMQTAIGPNISVMELVWGRGALTDIIPVPSHRLVREPFTYRLGMVTEEVPVGVPFDRFPDKFVLFTPQPHGGFPFRRTLTQASILPYLFTHFSGVDWLSFSELYGSPWRIGKYDDLAPDEDRQTLQDMLENLGADTAATMSKGWDIQLIQATGTGETYERQVAWAESKLSILWLGQTLTTDVGNRGSFAAASVHENVRSDLLASDMRVEAGCVESQVIAPLVRMLYPGREVPLPTFRRRFNSDNSNNLTIDHIAKAVAIGLPVMATDVYEKLGLKKPEGLDIDNLVLKTIPESGPAGPPDGDDAQDT